MGDARVLLIRHAESTFNATGRWQGQGDPPLSSEGRRQARTLARALGSARARFDSLVASDLSRARETAEILGAALSLVPSLDPRLRERDVGAWSGLTHAEIARRFSDDFARFRAGDRDVRLGGGETTRELEVRVRSALAELRARFAGGRIAVVTHRGVTDVLAPASALANAETCWLSPRAC